MSPSAPHIGQDGSRGLRRLASMDPADWLVPGEADELAALAAGWHESDTSAELFARVPSMRSHLLVGGPWRPAEPLGAQRVCEYAEQAVRALVAQSRREACRGVALRRGVRAYELAASVGLGWA